MEEKSTEEIEVTKQQNEEAMSETSRSLSFDISMSSKILYDYMVNHAYSGSSGILGTCFGFLGIIFYAKTGYILYLIIGVVLLFYLPVNLRYRAALQMQNVESFKKPLHYEVDENGITVSQGEVTETVGWEQCTKAVSTKLSIVVYTGKANATIFPRKQLEDKLPVLIATIAENMEPQKVKIRF